MPIYKLADLTVEMQPHYNRLQMLCRPYLVDGSSADISILPSAAQLAQISAEHPEVSAEECEYIVMGTAFYDHLIDRAGMLLHASCVAVNGRAYLFSADSGTGKSTHTALYKQIFANKAQIINDDKPAIRRVDGNFYAYGTPFCGKDNINFNARAKIAGICFLSRGEQNSIRPVDAREMLPLLLQQTIMPSDEARMDRLLATVESLAAEVPMYALRCNMHTDAAKLSYTVMSGEQL